MFCTPTQNKTKHYSEQWQGFPQGECGAVQRRVEKGENHRHWRKRCHMTSFKLLWQEGGKVKLTEVAHTIRSKLRFFLGAGGLFAIHG